MAFAVPRDVVDMAGSGVLAIWNDCAPGFEADLDRWYRHEHLPERLAVPGFLHGRRLTAITGRPRYFTHYEVESPAVLRSADYLHRLDHPTAETRRMMQQAFRNMSRTACRRELLHEGRRGPYAVTVRMSDPAHAPMLRKAQAQIERAAHAELWIAHSSSHDPSVEERLRGSDTVIGACLLLEFEQHELACSVAGGLDGACPDGVVGLYELITGLDAADEAPASVSAEVGL